MQGLDHRLIDSPVEALDVTNLTVLIGCTALKNDLMCSTELSDILS